MASCAPYPESRTIRETRLSQQRHRRDSKLQSFLSFQNLLPTDYYRPYPTKILRTLAYRDRAMAEAF